ncbi:MAG: AI-2E family transporter, partial [Gammaproteobacteria bacterium]|nr:AI-2E family transporter [Gammaproteobacteria bacterium]
MLQDNENTPQGRLPRLSSSQPVMRWEHVLPLATRLLVWGLLFGLLTLLSSFFTLIFLTFVFAYLQSGIVDVLAGRVKSLRIPMVVVTGTVFLSIIIAVTVFLAPKVYQQAAGFAQGFGVYMQRMDAELLDLAERYPLLQEALPELRKPEPPPPPATNVPPWAAGPLSAPATATATAVAAVPVKPAVSRSFGDTPSGALLELLSGSGDSANGREVLKRGLDRLANISRQTAGMLATFLLALLFSFLIVLDLPRLSASVRELEHTRLRFIYVEVADNIYEFGKVLGHAMQAQFYIAIVNTCLTAIGLHLMGLGNHVAFLSVIVFLCSFIPVAGVFISSVPICLIALNTGGAKLVMFAVGMITFIHMVEGYV